MTILLYYCATLLFKLQLSKYLYVSHVSHQSNHESNIQFLFCFIVFTTKHSDLLQIQRGEHLFMAKVLKLQGTQYISNDRNGTGPDPGFCKGGVT